MNGRPAAGCAEGSAADPRGPSVGQAPKAGSTGSPPGPSRARSQPRTHPPGRPPTRHPFTHLDAALQSEAQAQRGVAGVGVLQVALALALRAAGAATGRGWGKAKQRLAPAVCPGALQAALALAPRGTGTQGAMGVAGDTRGLRAAAAGGRRPCSRAPGSSREPRTNQASCYSPHRAASLASAELSANMRALTAYGA